jgi:hypothetical protein
MGELDDELAEDESARAEYVSLKASPHIPHVGERMCEPLPASPPCFAANTLAIRRKYGIEKVYTMTKVLHNPWEVG